MAYNLLILLFLVLKLSFTVGEYSKVEKNVKRSKKSILTFPPPSVFQVTLGISVEGDIEGNAAGVSLAFQHNANLPTDPLPIVSARDFTTYHHIIQTINRYGYNGMECLKKMICEISRNPLGEGVLEEMITYLLSPSRHANKGIGKSNNNFMEIFIESQNAGKSGQNCTSLFPECKKTPLEIITQV